MKLKIIESEQEYNEALERMLEIFDAKPNSVEGQEANLLALLIENYEESKYQIEAPDPIMAVKIRMEELQLKQKDLVGKIGSKSIVSDVLNRKRRLTVEMIRALSELLFIDPKILIKDYQLN
jgi:HTH-type transcriptional regulator / antitoxin HigA